MNERFRAILQARLNEPRHLLFGIAILSLTLLVLIIVLHSYGLSSQIPWFTAIAFLFGALFLLSSTCCVLSFIPPVRSFLVLVWRKRLFTLVAVITLIALFYAVENWRGWRAWQSYKQPRAARGERFELIHYIPPAVPDEQNFFETPLWNDMHFSQELNTSKEGYQISWQDTNWAKHVIFDVFGPEGGDDRNLSTWLYGRRINLDAWQAHYRGSNNTFATASGGTTNYFPVSERPQSPAEDVLLALSKFEGNRRLLLATSSRPEARFWINYDSGWAALLPHLARMRSASRYLSLHAEAARTVGDNQAALADIKAGFRLVEAVRSEPIIVSHLVRIKMLENVLQPIWGGLADHQWTAEELKIFDAELKELDFLADFEFSMRGERAFNLWLIDYMLEASGQQITFLFSLVYDLNRRRPGSNDLPLNPAWVENFGSAVVKLAPRGWFYQNKRSMCEVHDRYVFSLADTGNRIVSPTATTKAEAAFEEPPMRVFEFLPSLLAPAMFDNSKKYAHGQAMVDLARVAFALERYRIAHGNFPETLEVLVPQFLGALPNDIVNGRPLRYRVPGDGRFILYSVGWNLSDESGEVPASHEETETLESGDWVWKYPEP